MSDWLLCIAWAIASTSLAEACSAEVRMAVLVDSHRAEDHGPETQAALQLARKLHQADVLAPDGEGAFFDASGGARLLAAYGVLWYHQGDSIDHAGLAYHPKTLDALRTYVADGHSLYLSGAALSTVRRLRVEPIQPRRGGPGTDGARAALVPLCTDHPIFQGLSKDGRPVEISNRGFPAFADFHASGGPTRGMLLARTPGGSENPLVEYELGKGRIVVMGWRLPHYSYLDNPYRGNLERLTANILDYLADCDQWQKIVLRPVPGPRRPKVELGVPEAQWRGLELAIRDLQETFGSRYPEADAYMQRLAELEKQHSALRGADEPINGDALAKLDEIVEHFRALQSDALLVNPLLDFDQLLLVRRGSGKLGLPRNWQSNSSLAPTGYDNQIAVLSPVSPGGKLRTLLDPEGGQFVGDVDLHFDAQRLLFSMPNKAGRWRVHEMHIDGTGLHELPLINEPDVSNYDACYLPDGRVVFTSTAPFVGVPCVRGSSHVTNLYLLEADGTIRQLTVDQEHNWCPTVLNNGRVLYQRWEYADTPHAFYRLLFHMNPDGTGQMEYYGSNSYWPNALFYARPIPNHPTKFVAVIGGHHDQPRIGELILFDTVRGRFEADGVVQRIPGRGEPVEPLLLDGLTRNRCPRFLHPYPLSEKHILVSCQPANDRPWGIYLVDVFDNFVLLHEEDYYAMLEPIPVRKTWRPPVIPDRIDRASGDAIVLMTDVYEGGGLKGVPRGSIKELRLISYHFAYHGMGGQVDRVGLDGPWDVKQMLGTVPVEDDGSAHFRIPAYTPISVQPLDAEGKAVQLMRSWFTAMPGEVLSCVGCHERQNTSPPSKATIAAVRPPSAIASWYGPARGFSFRREVQPVLDRHCVSCHSSATSQNGQPVADLTDRPDVNPQGKAATYNGGAHFPPSYMELRKLVRSPTLESDAHLLPPREFHADTTRLVRMLQKGHYGVQLDTEAWERFITWIDLHTPAHGTWSEIVGEARVAHQNQRRCELRSRYTGMIGNPEAIIAATATPLPVTPVEGQSESLSPRGRSHTNLASEGDATSTTFVKPLADGWPFDAAEAAKRQQAAGPAITCSFEIGPSVTLEMVLIPAGEFVMGDENGENDERPPCCVKLGQPFWLGRFEITNQQYGLYHPSHESRLEHGDFLQFSHRERGYPLDASNQPVVRVSWRNATGFCGWLSARTGRRFSLPTEAQWEYACRAGTTTPFWYGDLDSDFSPFANVSDATHHSVDTFGFGLPSGAIPPWRPADTRFDDHHRVSAPVGTCKPNPWGLCDMHGNVSEWTQTAYRPYPYDEGSGCNSMDADGKRIVRGGSWYDRPKHCRSSFRSAYPPDQVVFDVGFRVICEADEARYSGRQRLGFQP